MFMDAALYFDNGVAHLTTEASTDYIDFGVARDMGIGEDLYCVAIVSVAFTDGSSNSTMALTLETDDNTSFSSATTAATIGTFAALSAIGTRKIIKLPPLAVNERYLRVKYTIDGNGDLTTGAFKVFLTMNPHMYVAYANGYTYSAD